LIAELLMKGRDIHETHDFFEYIRLEDSVPAADKGCIDVVLLDMNHEWPNVGHDSIVHVVLEAAETYRRELVEQGRKVRVLSFDVRHRLMIPESPNGRFRVYLGTGGPGHLDPRLNDGQTEWSQGINETDAWEAPLFRLYDDILADEQASMFAICHSFGLVCRWSGVARPELRAEKSSGMPLNSLSDEAIAHPCFRVVDNRLFDLVLQTPGKGLPIAYESDGSAGLTMIELARDAGGAMPRFLGVNHHPEIIDRDHIMQVLEEKRSHGEVGEKWYRERVSMMRDLFQGELERQSRVTSRYTLIEPLRFQLGKLVRGE
jgi:hypothetical protein